MAYAIRLVCLLRHAKHKVLLFQVAIQDRFEAWVPLTEADFLPYTPHTLQQQREAALGQEQAVALRPAHFALPVPADRGQQRVAMHGIMRRHPHGKAAPAKPFEVRRVLNVQHSCHICGPSKHVICSTCAQVYVVLCRE